MHRAVTADEASTTDPALEPKRTIGCLFCFVGAALTIFCKFFQANWILANGFASYQAQPLWFRGLWQLLGWLPWIALLLCLALRLKKGPQVRVGCFAVGVMIHLWLAGAATLFVWTSSASHRIDFDEELWRNPSQVEHEELWPPRLCMVDDLLASEQLEQLSRTQVIELLGEPASKDFPYGAVNCDIHYWLGPNRGLIRLDSEWLFITFDEHERVDRCWLYTD